MTDNPKQSLWAPFWAIVAARFLEYIRRPESIFWVYVFPLLMVVILGIAFRNRPVESVFVDVAAGPGSERIETVLSLAPNVKFTVYQLKECQSRLRTGKSDLYVTADGESPTTIHYFFDPTRPGCLATKAAIDNHFQRAAGRIDPIASVEHAMEEQGGRYIDFLVPGLLGMGLLGGGLWGVGFAIVDMRIRKLLKRFMATPMRKRDFLLGMMTSRLFFMIPEIVILVVFSRLLFDVQVNGSYMAIFVLVLLGSFVFSGIGLLVASRARTIETVVGLMNLVMLPMWTLSGIFFSTENFPAVVQPVIKALPLTALNDALRAVINEGASLTTQLPELAILLAWGVGSLFLALKFFRWSD